MAFDPPTLDEMRTAVSRALRDTAGSVFAPDVITDFITTALQDLSDYRAKETLVVATWPLPDLTAFADLTGVWLVQYRYSPTGDISKLRVTLIPPVGRTDGRSGWDFYGKTFMLSNPWSQRLDALVDQGWAPELLVWGYADRTMPVADTDVLDIADATDYNCVLSHCKHLGFELLNHDRALYQQWLAATNNTDVSPTQLQGMTAGAEQGFERMRSRNSIIRRVPAGSAAYSY